ncbi:MAG TPA: dihydrolipoamide acetyltransferase family protein [Methanomassiliicoccales archaeon]|nr:dihydrolipoamide acetyltransferase family protein [Methanomassiliicoccales archaeon]
MPTDFRFPDLGEGVTEGEIKKWLVKEGDQVKQDQAIAEVETDKAVVEMPSPTSGKVLRLYHGEGDTVKVGEVLATIGAEGEEAPKAAPKPPAEEARKPSVSVVGELPEEEILVSSQPAVATQAPPTEALATPAVRKLAKDLGVDLAGLKGSGPGGRLTEEDVRAATKPKGPTRPRQQAKFDIYGYIDREPVKGIRKSTAKKMMESTLKTAMVTMMDDADVTELVALRERIKTVAMEERKVKLTYMPFIIKAVVMALKNNPYLNSSMDEESGEIILKKYYNIGVAVATEDGLMVPVVKVADQKEIMDIAGEVEDLSKKAGERKIDLGDLKGGTFTITNYGTLGGTYGNPIINYPESAILGVGRIREMAWVKNGQVVPRKVMPLSLTWDHRILDGAQAAKFMGELLRYLENPDLILAMH